VDNEEQAAHWDGLGGEHWAAEQERYDRMLGPFGERIIEALAPQPGERVLDVGCGNGDLTLRVAERLAPGGKAVGVDLSGPMLERARRRAEAAGLDGVVHFEHADAQLHRFDPGSFDGVVSRFGVMFFDDPAAAFANLAAALRPGGRVALMCWRELLANEWLMVPAAAALEHVPMPDLGGSSGPGPFSLAEPEGVRVLLTQTGLDEIQLAEIDELTWMGESGDDTLAFLQRTEMAQILMADVEEERAARAWAAVARALDERAGPDGVRLQGSAWLVTAHRPG
jgi:SAM-dependent methyltransferase